MIWIILPTGLFALFWGWFFNWLFEPIQTNYMVFYYVLPFVLLGFLRRTYSWFGVPLSAAKLAQSELTFWGIPLGRILKFFGIGRKTHRPQSALIAQDVLPIFVSVLATPVRKKDRQIFHDFLDGMSRQQRNIMGKVFTGAATEVDYAALHTETQAVSKRRWSQILWSWRLWLVLTLQFAVVALLFGVWCFANIWYQLPSREQLDAVADHVQLKLYKDGNKIDVSRTDWINDLYTPLDEIPEHFRRALVFREDRQFYEHRGITLKGFGRTFLLGGGGSTLTQQLARNAFLSISEASLLSTLRRKLKEVIFALKLEQNYSKDQLLEMYLNKIAFGYWRGSYGIEIGARTYFQKHARDLSLYESALMIQAIPNPSAFNFKTREDRARKRTANFLAALKENEVFSSEEIEQAIQRDVVYGDTEVPKRETRYLLDWIRPQIENEAYFQLIEGEFTVVTTLNARMQAYAEETVRSSMTDSVRRKSRVEEIALVTLAPDGAVQAIIGSRDYARSQFSRVTSAKRQPGSAFKIFVYLAALQRGWEPDDLIADEPVILNKKTISNWDDKYLGPLSLTRALTLSRNPPPISLIQDQQIGVDAVVRLAQQMGISTELRPTPLLALGVSEVNLLELTSAYTVLANGGFAVKPYGVIGVRTKNGHIRYWRKQQKQRILANKFIRPMNQMLTSVVAAPDGTGRRGSFSTSAGEYQIAGKTGTTNDYRDAWFLGFTSQLCTGVWMGNDDYTPMNHVSGGRLPARIFSKFMQAVHESLDLLPEPLP